MNWKVPSGFTSRREIKFIDKLKGQVDESTEESDDEEEKGHGQRARSKGEMRLIQGEVQLESLTDATIRKVKSVKRKKTKMESSGREVTKTQTEEDKDRTQKNEKATTSATRQEKDIMMWQVIWSPPDHLGGRERKTFHCVLLAFRPLLCLHKGGSNTPFSKIGVSCFIVEMQLEVLDLWNHINTFINSFHNLFHHYHHIAS